MISAALIGLGNIAWRYSFSSPDSEFSLSQGEAMRRHAKVELIGACSPDMEDREGFKAWAQVKRVFADAQEMLDELKPDMVGICSPSTEHFIHARLCLEAGARALWLEKPPAMTVQELDELISLAHEKNVSVCVNFPRRYNPVYSRLKQILQDEEFGLCRIIRVLYSPGLARNGIHLLDQLFFLSGADDYELLWAEEANATASPSFILRLSSGHLVHASGADLSYHTNEISLVFERGMISIRNGGRNVLVEESVENLKLPGFYNLNETDAGDMGFPPKGGGMDAALADLVTAFEQGEQPRSNLITSRPAQRLMQQLLVRT